MVAKLYPHDFKLRDKSLQALKRHKAAATYFTEDGEEILGMEVLKLVALREHLRQRRAGRRLTVRGVRESDVLDLDPAVVKREWARAVRDYVAALVFVRDRCGAVRPGVLPSRTMLLPIANALSSGRRSGWREDLERFFWVSCFEQTYGQGANTQAVADAGRLGLGRSTQPRYLKRSGTSPAHYSMNCCSTGVLATRCLSGVSCVS